MASQIVSTNNTKLELQNHPFWPAFSLTLNAYFNEIKNGKRNEKLNSACDFFNYLDFSLAKIDWRKHKILDTTVREKTAQFSREEGDDAKPLRELVQELQHKWWPEPYPCPQHSYYRLRSTWAFSYFVFLVLVFLLWLFLTQVIMLQ